MKEVADIWKRIAAIPIPKAEPVKRKRLRAKRSKKEMIKFAEDNGLEIKFDYYHHGRHAIFVKDDYMESLQHSYGSGSADNLLEIEWCIEEYLSENK